MRYMVRAVPERAAYVEELSSRIPGLDVWMDEHGDAMRSFLEALTASGDQPMVLLEDDVELTVDFCVKAERVIAVQPSDFITFFSLSKKKTTSRYQPGSAFCMMQCIYLPAGWASQVVRFHADNPNGAWLPTGTDTLLAAFMQSQKRRYWLHCPSLVQHRQGPSVIDRRRSSARQSVTFLP